ncbi:MAG: polymer-forming cytoskeletal protein [Treponema sp.]|jgi:cytoskeletal protein CcmA (bactofilin family)|nr:polymer-forming cytoskeletal protein [Treponema sp.]
MASRRNDFSINTIIGPNSSVSGNLEIGGFTRIDGNVRGDVSAQGRVVIGEDARMRSNISGTAVTVGGVVRGNVLASERLTVLSTGLVIGDVITRRIRADEGCLIHGRIQVCPTEESWNRALSEYRDAQGVKSVLSSFSEAYD